MAVTFCEIFVNSLELVAFGDHKRPTLFARFRSILSGRDWVYLSGLLVPFVVYNLVLKGIRIDSQEELPGGFAAFALIRSDLLFNLGYVFLWVGLFALTRRSRLRWPVVVLFHTVTIVVIATTTSAHGYFQETGSTLSLSVITYSLGSLGEITDVIGSVTSLAIWAWVLVILGYLVFGPWIIATLVCGKRGEPRRFGSPSTARLFALGAFTTALGLIFLSLPVGAGVAGKSFSRDAVVNIVMSEVEHARIRDLVSSAASMEPPVDTRLEKTAETEKKNVVLIHLESARARSMTPYNEDLDTTRYLDRLAENSLLAERAYTIVPHTSKAVTSINCGIDPHLVREISEVEPGGVPAMCLPELLKEQGYSSVWFSSATEHFEDRRDLVENFGYEDFRPVESMETEGFQKSNYFGYEDNIMLQPSREWLEQHKGEPFVATYLGVTGHHDYRPVDRYGLKDYSKLPGLDHYQNEMRYLDFFVRNVIDQYKELGLYDDTIFVIYGDHGEGFGEHDLYQHTNIKIPAQRGVVYDRDGKILANNVPGLNVTVIPDEISRDKVRELATVVGAGTESVLARYDAAMETGSQYSPILVKENAGRDAVTYVSERTGEFTGVAVNDDWVRSYPEGRLAAHILGYTGAVNHDELKQEPFEGLPADSIVGKSGVELSYEVVLRGKAGQRTYNVDALGRIVPEGSRVDSMGRFVDENGNPINVNPSLELPDHVTEPEPGNNLTLTIDIDLQRVVEKELDAALERTWDAGYDGRGGAVVAMNPDNGEILAMASRPDFDPQLFVGGISGGRELAAYNYLASDRSNDPFLNRAIVGGQPGASTFKIFTGIAGLAAGVIDAYTIVNDTAVMSGTGCWMPSSVSASPCYRSWRQNSPNYHFLGDHGPQNLSEAIADSNDIFFYQVADWIWNETADKDWLPHYYERWGFGRITGIDISGETEGRIPTEQGEKELHKALHGTTEGAFWSVGDWVNLAIGQGDLLVSPIQMARAYSALYNGGTLVTPHVGKEITDQSGKVVETFSPKPAGRVDTNQYQIDLVTRGLRGVTQKDGTAGAVFVGSTLPVAGKSGTGELPAGKDYVNWFAGWVEGQEEQPLVVVTMIEGGGAFQEGSEMTAGPVVRHILEAYYGVEQSSKDPHSTDTPPLDPADHASTESESDAAQVE